MKLIAADPIQVASAATATVGVISSWALSDWSVAIFGVPLATVMAAFAGAFAAHTFSQPKPWRSLLSYLAASTLIGAYVAPLLVKAPQLISNSTAGLDGLDKPIAFLLGLTAQVSVPALFSRIKKEGGNGGP